MIYLFEYGADSNVYKFVCEFNRLIRYISFYNANYFFMLIYTRQ